MISRLLEQLAAPCAVRVGAPLPTLEDVFSRVVADGWEPRNPCTDPAELEQLEASRVRGHCIAPLAVANDTLLIDPDSSPLPGDLVSFRLSERGASAQNSCLPEGQSPASPGDSWCKLLVNYRTFPMLLDRFGSSATATLLACEHPDDTPVLRPVRNILRAGRLLYGPETLTSGLGGNAATVTLINNTGSAGSNITGFTGKQSTGFALTPTSQPGYACTVRLTATIQGKQTTGGPGDMKFVLGWDDAGSGTYTYSSNEVPIASTGFQSYTLIWEFTHSAANTGSGRGAIFVDNTGPSTNVYSWQIAALEGVYIIR